MMKLDFNSGWSFKNKKSNDQVMVDLPHDAMLYEKRDPKCMNNQNSGYFPGGYYLYEKTFDVKKEYLGQYVALQFEGVYQKATIYLNDEKITYHVYGYTGFEVELSNLKVGTNTVRVEVDNVLEPNSRWYSGSGIYRPVYLLVKDKEYIQDVKVDTITIGKEAATIRVTCSKPEAKVIIFDGQQKVYNGVCGEIQILNAKYWSAENPYLYRIFINTDKDQVEQTFGIRKIEWTAQKGLLINDKMTKLRGGCVHHDNGILGACAFKDAEYRKVQILKEAGYNAIRSAHNPCSEAMLHACDELGMYVMDESFDQWFIPKTKNDYAREFDDNYLEDLKAMVEKDYNHPSVIIYSVGNEISETAQERGIKLSKELVEYVHSLDTSRPVTCGINLFLNGLISKGIGIYSEDGEGMADQAASGENDKMEKLSGSAFYNFLMEHLSAIKNIVSLAGFADKATKEAFSHYDICGYNYGTARYKKDGKKYCERVIVGSETYIPELYNNWKNVMKYSYVVGDFVWTAWDYLGEAGIGTWRYGQGGYAKPYPMISAGSGTIDLTGYLSPQAYYSRVAYGIAEDLRMAVRPVNRSGEKCMKSPWRVTDAVESWSWNGCEGREAQVEVYSDDARIVLLLNDKEIGKGRPKKGICRFCIPYQSGVLTAKSYDNHGNNIKTCQLCSASGNPQLQAKLEERGTKCKLVANGQSLAYIDIAITDPNGNIFVLMDTIISVKVEGVGYLQGIGSAANSTDEPYVGSNCTTYFGRAQAVIRAGYEPGEIKVTVSANGYEEVVLSLLTVEL